jgi:DNA mismatch repair protein MutL
VNVHPTKLEVKFSSEKTVFDAIYLAVRNALLNDTTRPGLQLEKKDVDHKAIGTYNRFTPVYDRMDEDTKPAQQAIFSGKKEPIVEEEPKKQEGSVPTVPFDDLPFVFEDIVKAHEEKIKNTETHSEPSNSEVKRVECEEKRTESEEKTAVAQKEPPFSMEEPFAIPILPEVSLPSIEEDARSKKEVQAGKEAFSKASAQQLQTELFLPQTVPACKSEAPANQSEVPVSDRSQGQTASATKGTEEGFLYLGIAFETYILVEKGDTLLMIDKHAAHERLLFEEMKKNRASSEKYTQLLMVPLCLEVSDVECATILEYEEELKSTGYLFEKEDLNRSFLLSGIPGGLEREQAEVLFMTMVTRLADGEGTADLTREIAFEKALYTASCKAAMKGGRKDDKEHLLYLCKKLFELPDIRYCPHGRPVAFEIPKGSIEHRFKRS